MSEKVLPSHEEFLDAEGEFTTFFGSIWTIETKWGVFSWSNPEYGGTGQIKYVCATWNDYRSLNSIRKNDFGGRCKGTRVISRYIGNQFKLEF